MEQLIESVFPQELAPIVVQVLSQMAIYLAVLIGVIVAYQIGKRQFSQKKQQTAVLAGRSASQRLWDDPDPLDPIGIPALAVPRTPRPTDARYFEAVRRFAAEKQDGGLALIPEETFAIGPVAFIATLLGTDGFEHLDSYPEELPHKSWALRQAAERIGAAKCADPLEQASAIFLHRGQVLADIIATGMPAEQAMSHPDRPSYDKVETLVAEAGGIDRFLAAADQYFAHAYPWADQSENGSMTPVP